MRNFTRGEMEAEVVGARAQLASSCGIPEADIVGFRQPYLQSSPVTREASGGRHTDQAPWGRSVGPVARTGIVTSGAELLPRRSPSLPLQVLHAAGFTYDSTLLEEVHASLGDGFGDRVWPYTMQDGIPQNVAW